MLILRAIQAALLYGIGAFYALQFVLQTALQFLADPDLAAWLAKKRSVAPTLLGDPRYGTHRFVEVNGVKLHYVEKGDPGKPLMLFLHGFPEFWFSWRHQLEEFSKDYWTVAVDLRGYGQSEGFDARAAYQIDVIVEDIRSLVRALGRDRVIVVGHDWGAVLGFQFVSKHMDMVDRYVMMGGPSLNGIRRLLLISWQQFRMSWYTFFFLIPWLPEFYIWGKDFGYIEQNMGGFLTKSELEAYKYTFSQRNAVTRAIDYYRENLSFLRKEQPLPRLENHSPGLYLIAEHDQFISLRSGRVMERSLPNLWYRIVPGTGHYMQQESHRLVNKMIRDFLDLSG
ncbi:hypothetical protein pipiens_006710 [Culex pipiens pipiens]|uniref:AB hydrolase-1 domain-containing protein n=1 Tax=Culex pipiens pipiens TaxID=38569 RepID=A0ABD1DPH6_CULPP